MLIKLYVRYNAPKPESCWNCGKSGYIEKKGGEWVCSNCHTVQHQ